MNPPFLTFRRFNDEALATSLVETLNQHDIEYQLAEELATVDITFSNNPIQKEFIVKLKDEDFARAQTLLDQLAESELNGVPKDHYLYSFADQELYEVIEKADEWSEFDVALAKKMLKERGLSIDINMLKQNRIAELSRPDDASGWVLADYLLLPLAGILSVAIGYSLYQRKKTLPNGERVYGYQESARKHGKIIFVLGVLAILIFIALRIAVVSKEY